MKLIFLFSMMLGCNGVAFAQTTAPVSSTNSWPTNLTWIAVSNRWAPLPVAEIKQAAEKGELTAKYFLGRAYMDGLGLPQDRPEGLKWMRLASDGGYPHAQMMLGYMYEKGDLVAPDHGEALRLYRLAADHGDARAQNNLGWAYQQGNGVPKDPAEAAKWYRKSAGQSDPLAEANLSWLYLYGLGVEKDYEQAEKWARLGAESGMPRLQFNYAEILVNESRKDGNVVANYAVAAEWYKKAAEQNYPEAQMALADLYNYGKLDRNYNEAVKWYSRAATNGSGNVKAMGMLGSLYHDNHENFPHDHAQSARWFRMAAEKGETGAGYELALLLLDGEIPHNQPEAETLLKKAADEGNANAAIRLAGLHHETPQSALKQFSRDELNARAVNGNGAIVLQAATADEEGRGGPIDVRGAAGLYLRILMYAPDDGKTEAINRLVDLYYSDKLKLEKPSAGPPADFGSWSDAAQLFFWSGPKNEKQLAEIFQRSRKFASPLTQYHVGEMYYRGEPVAQDKGLAVDWFKSAAEAGNPEAMNRIGEFWASGAGGQQDVKEAAGWYRRAAEKGSGPGELNLGRALEKAEGVEQNAIEAWAWLDLAAEQKVAAARQEADALSAKFSPEEKAAAKARAQELAKQISSHGEK